MGQWSVTEVLISVFLGIAVVVGAITGVGAQLANEQGTSAIGLVVGVIGGAVVFGALALCLVGVIALAFYGVSQLFGSDDG